jgi:hypothetical protein
MLVPVIPTAILPIGNVGKRDDVATGGYAVGGHGGDGHATEGCCDATATCVPVRFGLLPLADVDALRPERVNVAKLGP